jgi:uncharacterized protein (AIM24 family)
MPIFGSVPSVPSSGHHRSASLADDIEFEIKGAEMQFAEIELDPGESVVAEAGALMFKDASIGMDTIFGDGTKREGGLFGALKSAGKRILTGEAVWKRRLVGWKYK